MLLTLFDQPIQPHQHEKDSAGTAYVQENKERLTKEAEKVYELLKRGFRLNNKQCITDGITGSLSSRVSEINKYLEQFDIVISKEWKYIDGVKSYKEYFLTEEAINKLK